MFETLIGVVLGGVITFLSTFFLQKANLSHTDKILLKERKLELYTNLINELQRINIPIIVESSEVNLEELTIDTDEVNAHFNSFVNYLEENLGAIHLFVENNSRREILKLQSEIFALIDNSNYHTLSLKELKNSAIYKAIMHANKISNQLRHEIIG